MTTDEKEAIALMKYSVIVPLINGSWDPGKSNKAFFRDAAGKTYSLPNGKTRKYSAPTIERWYNDYRKEGFQALLPHSRSDEGRFRALDDDLRARILYMHEQHPRIPASEIRRQLLEDGLITENSVSESTINRFLARVKAENQDLPEKERRRYERSHINEVWCADTSYGPYLSTQKGKQRIYVIALLDDASRFVLGVDVFFNDNFCNFMSVCKSAVSKYGYPNVFNLDNGSSFKNKQMELLAARLGSSLNYCHPYQPQEKAKIERWFRTMKDHWMAKLDMRDFKTLDELRADLLAYVAKYNRTPHCSLNGKTPEDRFFSEPERIRRIPREKIDRLFLLEVERRVSVDCVFTIDSIAYETDSQFSKQRITVRYSPDMSEIYVVAANNTLIPVRLLNKQENAITRRKQFRYSEVSSDA